MKKFWILKVVMIAIVAVFAFSLAVMLLWNWLVPELFGGPVITFWQALGLLVLSKILFSGFGRKGPSRGYGSRKPFWRKRFEEKWEKMTPEEREKFKARFKHRCGSWGWPVDEEKENSSDTELHPSTSTKPS